MEQLFGKQAVKFEGLIITSPVVFVSVQVFKLCTFELCHYYILQNKIILMLKKQCFGDIFFTLQECFNLTGQSVIDSERNKCLSSILVLFVYM